jgi:hypothetical protein
VDVATFDAITERMGRLGRDSIVLAPRGGIPISDSEANAAPNKPLD